MNRVYLIGNLTRDPELKTINDKTAVVDLGLAINEKYRTRDGKEAETTCFVDVTVWNGQARVCADELTKGSPVMIEGKLQFDQWKDKDGGNRSKLRVKADRIRFLKASAPKSAEKERSAA